MFHARLLSRLPAAAAAPVRLFSSAAGAGTIPPFPDVLRADLKTAMRAKQTAERNAIRALLAATTAALKERAAGAAGAPAGPADPADPAELLAQDRAAARVVAGKLAAAAQAAAQFRAGGRADLAEVEEAEAAVLGRYRDVLAGRIGAVAGPPVERAEIVAVVAEVLAAAAAAGGGKTGGVGVLVKEVLARFGEREVDRKEVAEQVKAGVGR